MDPEAPALVARPAWKPVHYLALLGCVFLFFEIWTIASWLADGPMSVTKFRDSGSASWIAARVNEALVIVLAIVILTYVARQCVRERRIVFDAKFCIAGALLYWLDPFVNFAQPIYFYNSNWVNLQNWCGHAPFVVNPDCGRLPEPLLFLWPMYTFGFLSFAILLNAFMRFVKNRRPSISNVRLVLLTAIAGALIDVAVEVPSILLKLWSYPGWPLSVMGGGSHRYPLVSVFIATLVFTGLAGIRFFKDDHGLTIVEPGLPAVRPKVRVALSVLALVGASQALVFVGNAIEVTNGPFLGPFPKLPAYVINDMCDAPGVTATRYGTCPGTPGYRAPLRRLPGKSP